MTANISQVELTKKKTYALCKETGSILYRYRGHEFSDGHVDSDAAPVWTDESLPDKRHISEAELLLLPEVYVQAPHDPATNHSNVMERIRQRILDAEVLLHALADPRTYQHSDCPDVLITAMAQKALDYQSGATEAMELWANDPEPWKG